jgi:hypothetical protein
VTGGAWPFIVGRSRNAGYRVVVAPGFMKDGPRDDVERIGWLATSDVTGSAEAIVTEISGLATRPATAVFRNLRGREQDYFPAGRGLLTDSVGRPILLTEGFILELSRERVTELPLTSADMDRAHELVAPAFREFWQYNGDDYPQQYSGPFHAGGNPSAGTRLYLRLPRAAADGASSRPPARSYSPPPESGAGVITKSRRRAKYTRRHVSPPSNWRLIFAVTAAIGSVSLACLVIVSLISRPPSHAHTAVSSPSSSPVRGSGPTSALTSAQKSLLTGFCRALDAGDIHAAYALTARAFQAAVSEETFAADLLGGYTKAKSCVPGEFAAGSGASTAPLTITIETGAANPPISNPVYAWNVILISYRGKLLIAHLLPSTMKPQYRNLGSP